MEGSDWATRRIVLQAREELYAHTGDDSTSMDAWENVNVAAARSDVAAALGRQLRAFFASSSSSAPPTS